MKTIRIFFFLTVILLLSCSSETRNNLIIKHIDNLVAQGKYEEAKMTVDSFVNLNPENELAWNLKGHIEENLDNDSVAEIAYEKALSINPHMAQTLTGLGILSRKKKDYGKAIYYYNKAIQVDPNYAEAYSSLVTVELIRKNFENAVKFGEKGYQLEKNNPAIAANLSIAYHYYGDTVNRDKFYTIAKQLNYRNLDILQLIFKGEARVFDE